MPAYLFYRVDAAGALQESALFECADDLSAVAKGHEISTRHPVEVWFGGRYVAYLAKNAAIDGLSVSPC
jgi:hypothetical protein